MAIQLPQTDTSPSHGKLGDREKTPRIPEGWHHAVVIAVNDQTEAPPPGRKPRLGVRFAVIAPSAPAYNWAECWEDYYISGAALPRLAMLAVATGVNQGDPNTGEWTLEPADLIGHTVEIEIQDDQFERTNADGGVEVVDKKRLTFAGMRAWKPGDAERPTVDAALNVLRKWTEGGGNGAQAPAPAPAPAPRNAASPHLPQAADTDDVPF